MTMKHLGGLLVATALVALPSLAAAQAATRPAAAQAVPAEADWWWPALPAPRGIVRTTPVEGFEAEAADQGDGTDRQWAERGRTHAMVESASGLAAAAVRRGELDEMVWITTDNPNQKLAYDLLVQRLQPEDRGEMKPWELVQRLKDKGAVKGYVLYRRGGRGGGRRGDASVNVATSVAGPLRAIIVDESLEAKAKDLGLPMLLDARDKDSAWVFEHFRDRLNRRTAMFQDPAKPHARDYAVAHDVMCVYGSGEVEQKVLAWLEPLSPILGWNGGDEGDNARLFSQYGHFNTATDWAINLPLLSAGARDAAPARLPDPKVAESDDNRPVVSFVMSDGDNLQWMTQNFFRDSQPRYWDNPYRADFPLTWTLCLANMRQAAPDLMRYVADTIPANATAVEFGGGYYFPDRFGEKRDEPDLLAKQARKTWANMKAVNSDVLCLIFDDLLSEKARKAMEVYAREMPGLKGILAMDYYPYSQGEGKVFWIDREDGPPLPVATARLELRTDFKLPTTGGVAATAERLKSEPMPAQWVVQHAWSSYDVPAGVTNPAPAPDDDGRVTGLNGTAWAVDALGDSLRVVTAQEFFAALEAP